VSISPRLGCEVGPTAIHHDPQQAVPDLVSWDLVVEDVDITHDKWQAGGLLVRNVVQRGVNTPAFQATSIQQTTRNGMAIT
jgi:hypothetical protein